MLLIANVKLIFPMEHSIGGHGSGVYTRVMGVAVRLGRGFRGSV